MLLPFYDTKNILNFFGLQKQKIEEYNAERSNSKTIHPVNTHI